MKIYVLTIALALLGLTALYTYKCNPDAVRKEIQGTGGFQGKRWGNTSEVVYETPYVLVTQENEAPLFFVFEDGDTAWLDEYRAFFLQDAYAIFDHRNQMWESLNKVIDIGSIQGNMMTFNTELPMVMAINAMLMCLDTYPEPKNPGKKEQQ